MFFSSKNPLFINLVFTFFIQPSWNVPTKAHQPSFSHIFSTEILTPCGVKRTATGGCTRKIICSTNVAETSVTVRTPRWFGGFLAFVESSGWVERVPGIVWSPQTWQNFLHPWKMNGWFTYKSSMKKKGT